MRKTHECHSEPQAQNLVFTATDPKILRLRLRMIGTQSMHNK